ncbi:MAG: Do family serine endopeptidase [Planctomycetota bacterium]
MQQNWKQLTGALGAMLVGSLVTGVVMTSPGFLRNDPLAQEIPAARPKPLRGQDVGAARDLSTAFRNVSERIRPSVVSINTTQTEVVGRGPRGFEEFFGAPSRREASGTGSGVIVRADGYILTNNHVVEGADRLEVEFSDGSKIDGRIVGTDPQTDLAVVKVDREGLTPAGFGDSDAIQVGDWVLAIGSPFGLDQTVTAGIISGKNRVRRIVGEGDGFEDFLQTDAAINPGNSGGPLVNLNGELVGINTAIMSRSGSSAGIGFAIPVSLAQPVLDSIVKFGTVRRGFLGASLDNITPETVREYNLKASKGVIIRTLLDGMPAQQAGMREGDVVVAIDGKPMSNSDQMRNYVASQPPGDSMLMDVNRGGRSIRVKVDLRERTDEVMAQFRAGEVLGARLVPANPTTSAKYGYQNLESGLIVTALKDGSVAAGQLEVGDVIERVAGVAPASAQELQLILREASRRGRPVQLVIRRGNERMLLRLEN